jgi:hypothetical protein
MDLLLFFAMYISSDHVSSDMRTIYGLDLSELDVSDSFTFCSVLLRTELMLQLRDKSCANSVAAVPIIGLGRAVSVYNAMNT